MSEAARATNLDTAASRLGRGLLALRLEVSADIVDEIHQLVQAAIAEQTEGLLKAGEEQAAKWSDIALKQAEQIADLKARADAAEAQVERLRAMIAVAIATPGLPTPTDADGGDLCACPTTEGVCWYCSARALLADPAVPR